jgi:SIR2-like domain
MIEWSDIDKRLIKKYHRPIVHMRRQFQAGRFGLVFGTGLTQQLGIPGWWDLNHKLAHDPRVDGTALLAKPTTETIKDLLEHDSIDTICRICGAGPEETIITQRLFEHFRKRRYDSSSPETHHSVELNSDIQREWRNIIRETLYAEAGKGDPAELSAKILHNHKYLKHILPLIRHTPLTITYNFDDILEVILNGDRSPEERQRSRGYETTIDIRIPTRSKKGVVFHPNGYIPRNTMEGGYEGIVLSEDEFADRMIETMTGQYASLLHHYSKNTCVFVGLSLKDSILKNVLRQCATVTPGHYHYYIEYYTDNPPTEDEQIAIRNANFSTYNLITLFLNNDEIASLGRLVSVGYNAETNLLDHSDFCHCARNESVEAVYHFYVVGAVGAGKSTIVSHLRDLITHDEWVEDRLPELAEKWDGLSFDEKQRKKKARINNWIGQQFCEKNNILLDEKVGLIVSDRCPLDPLVFTELNEWQEKANFLLERVCPGTGTRLVPGHIILLMNDPKMLDLRVRQTNKQYRLPELKVMQQWLSHLYDLPEMTRVNCQFRSLQDIMKEVGRIIHLTEYKAADIHSRMQQIANSEYLPPSPEHEDGEDGHED